MPLKPALGAGRVRCTADAMLVVAQEATIARTKLRERATKAARQGPLRLVNRGRAGPDDVVRAEVLKRLQDRISVDFAEGGFEVVDREGAIGEKG